VTVETQEQGKWWAAPRGGSVAYCVALGATLRQLRTTTGRTCTAVAHEVLGTPPKQLRRYESGQAKPKLHIIAALCEAYDANPMELLTRVAIQSGPPAEQYAPWTDLQRFWLVWLRYDEAVPTRQEVERESARRRGGLEAVEDPTSP